MEISNYLKNEHRGCDVYFANTEGFVVSEKWDEAIKEFETFAHHTLLHFKKEEEELFPAFEAQTGNTEGPTRVMRYEHDQVRGLIGKMAESLEKQDKDAYLSLSESVMILLQQHNMKEEQMLYAMCDNILPREVKDHTLTKMQQVELEL